MCTLNSKMLAFWREEEGGQTVEWVIIAALLAAMLAAIFALGGPLDLALQTAITYIAGLLPG